MKILILGSSGGFGENLVNYLIKNTNYKLLLHQNNKLNSIKTKNVTYIKFDIEVDLKNFIKNYLNVDIIINCIGNYTNEKKMFNLNFKFIDDLFNKHIDQIIMKKIHWIQISSIGVYENKERFANIINEKSKIKTINYYEKTKLDADLKIFQFIKKCKHFSFTIIRPSILYGSHKLDTTLNKVANLLKNKFFFYINDDSAVLPFIHVDDVSKLITLSIDGKEIKSKNQIFNISNDVKLRDLFIFFNNEKKLNYKINFIYLYYPVLILDYIFKKNLKSKLFFFTSKTLFLNDKIESVFNFRPEISITKYYEKKNNKA